MPDLCSASLSLSRKEKKRRRRRRDKVEEEDEFVQAVLESRGRIYVHVASKSVCLCCHVAFDAAVYFLIIRPGSHAADVVLSAHGRRRRRMPVVYLPLKD